MKLAARMAITLATLTLAATAMVTGTGVAAAAVPPGSPLHADLTSGTSVIHEIFAQKTAGREIVVSDGPVRGHVQVSVFPTRTTGTFTVTNQSAEPLTVTLWTDPASPLAHATVGAETRLVVRTQHS